MEKFSTSCICNYFFSKETLVWAEAVSPSQAVPCPWPTSSAPHYGHACCSWPQIFARSGREAGKLMTSHRKASALPFPSWWPAVSRRGHNPSDILCCFLFCWALAKLLLSKPMQLFFCNVSFPLCLLLPQTFLDKPFPHTVAILHFYSHSWPGGMAPDAISLGLVYGRNCFYHPVAS